MNKQRLLVRYMMFVFVLPVYAAAPGNYYVNAKAAELVYKHHHKSTQERDKYAYEQYETGLIQKLFAVAKQFPVCQWTVYTAEIPERPLSPKAQTMCHLSAANVIRERTDGPYGKHGGVDGPDWWGERFNANKSPEYSQSICHPDVTKFTIETEHGTHGVEEAYVRWCLCTQTPHVILVQLQYKDLGYGHKTLIDISKPATERIEGVFPAAAAQVPYYVQYQRAITARQQSHPHWKWKKDIKPEDRKSTRL